MRVFVRGDMRQCSYSYGIGFDTWCDQRTNSLSEMTQGRFHRAPAHCVVRAVGRPRTSDDLQRLEGAWGGEEWGRHFRSLENRPGSR